MEPTTVRPPFDPAEFARESERTTVPPPAHLPSGAPIVSVEVADDVFALVGAETIPALTVAFDDLEWFDLPPLARRMLHHVDGASRLDEICSKAGDSLADAIQLVELLAREGLVSCR